MIVVIRLRGEAGTRRDVRDTFSILGMKKIYSAVVLEETPINMGMVRKVKDFAAWGEASEETTNAIGKLKNLKSPKGGLKSKKLPFPKGNLGYCGEKINDLVKKML